MKFKPSVKILFPLFLLGLVFVGHAWYKDEQEKERDYIKRLFKSHLKQKIVGENLFPDTIRLEGISFSLQYTIDRNLQNYAEKLLKRYNSDFSSIVVLENATGNILALTGRERDKGRRLELPLSASHPMASLAKIVTSADILEHTAITNETTFSFSGKGSTLYKYQLKNKPNKWTRFLSFEKAFALSNNVVFGKAAIYYSHATRLHEMAGKWGFNRKLMEELSLEISQFNMPRSQYHLAELATGLNDETLIGPIHAAVLASVVANEGTFVMPKLLRKIKVGKEYLKDLFPDQKPLKILSTSTAGDLSEMMEATLRSGTAKRAYRKMKRKLREGLEMGGKTGSITGGTPLGKRDWFTVYATPKEGESLGISVAVMNINIDKWFVKSTYLAIKMVEKYYQDRIQKDPILGEK